MSQSDSPAEFAAVTAKSADGSKQRVRRTPSDDPAWDELVPSHPLSRIRTQLLPQIAASIEISAAAKRLATFH